MPKRRLGRIPLELVYFLGFGLLATLLAWISPEFRLFEWTSWAAFGILALSFTFAWGRGGIFSFGQAAFFGIGAYAYGVVAINLSPTSGETLSALLIGGVIAALVAAILGYFIFYGNVGDVYVAIITLAVSLLLLTIMRSTADPKYAIGSAKFGGYNGMGGIPPIILPGNVMLTTRDTFIFTALVAIAIAVGVRFILRRPFGRILAAVRENELRTQLLGYDVRLHKLLAFALGGLMAGIGGGLYAAWGMIVNPAVFGLAQAALVAVWVLVGGRSSILGAFIGVMLVQGLTSTLGSAGGLWTPLVVGAVMIVVVLLLPNGLVPSTASLIRKLTKKRVTHTFDQAEEFESLSTGNELVEMMSRDGERKPLAIEGRGLTKRFGGVNAVQGVDLKVEPSAVRALIGPNGAGKSTTFNMLAGRYAPTKGRIFLGDRDVTRLRADQRARMGFGIKLQVPSFYGELSVRENLWLASYASFKSVKEADEQTQLALRWLSLEAKAEVPAKILSHGEHQWLEIGMVVAGRPSVMLLDEPTAGMTREQTQQTVTMIHELSEHMTVVVVEHDMEFLRALKVPVTMFHQGLVFVEGDIEELRRDERVLDTYLGRGNSHAQD